VPVSIRLPRDPPAQPRARCRRAVALGVLGAAALALGSLRRIEAVGDSMLPTLAAGDRLLAVRAAGGRLVAPGRVVAVRDPRPEASARVLLKRVHAVDGDRLDVRGDNPAASTDSRSFGPVSRRAVVGVALYRYHPPERAGFLGRAPAAGSSSGGTPRLRSAGGA
jgi:nickel-type superoxide dismutase maturation protease